MSPAQAAELYKLYKQGVRVKELMRRFDRSRSSIYRIVNRRRAKALVARRIEFIASNEFLEPDAGERILARPAQAPVRGELKEAAAGADRAAIHEGELDERSRPFDVARGSLPEYH